LRFLTRETINALGETPPGLHQLTVKSQSLATGERDAIIGAVQTISGQAVIDSALSGADKLLVEVYSVETVQKIFRDLNTNNLQALCLPPSKRTSQKNGALMSKSYAENRLALWMGALIVFAMLGERA